MATKKQLAALARGRAIRKANLKKRKSSKKTKTKYHKRTNFSFSELAKGIKNASEGFKVVGDVAGNIFAPLGAITTGIETGNRFIRAMKTLWEDERKVDSEEMKLIVNNMRKKLIAKDSSYEDGPLVNKLNEIYKNLLYIELLRSDGQDEEAKREIRNTLYLFSRALDEYNHVMGKR